MKSASIKEFFHRLPGKLDPVAAEDVDAVYQFELSGPQGGQYVVAIHQGVCTVTEGSHADPHVVLSMEGEDCMNVLSGQLSGQALLMSGRLTVTGDLGLALQLKALFPGIG